MPYTYMLKCSDDTFYTGWTTDLENRVKTHNSGKGSRYTRARLPVLLVYWEYYGTRSEAQKREYKLRQLNRKEKDNLRRLHKPDLIREVKERP